MTAPDYSTAPRFADLTVAPIDYDLAKRTMIENHYAHKWQHSFGVENYGIFRDGEFLGAAVYGHPRNPGAWKGITRSDPTTCLELNRLWIDDVLGTNTETWLMSQTFKLMRAAGYNLVQSFSDGRLGVGTIYQAANFTYHGFHQTRFHQDAAGELFHDGPFTNTASPKGFVERNAMHMTGDLRTFIVRTYRYLYPLNKAARRAIILPGQPYPKERAGEQVVEDYRPPLAQFARAVEVADAIGHPRYDEMRRWAFAHYGQGEAIEAMAKQGQSPWVAKARAKAKAAA